MQIFVAALFTTILFSPLDAFAAKKKGNKKARAASTNRGFGQAPPTLDEVLASFKTCKPDNAEELPCPCQIHPGKSYGECCAPYHTGLASPMTPLEVLQTRYSAFHHRNIGYVLQSTHPSCRDYMDDKIAWAKGLNKHGMFDSFEFAGLKVLGDEESVNANEAYVEFEVTLKAKERIGSLTAAELEDKTTTVRERSQFRRDETTGIWSYSGGDVSSTAEGVDDIVLNV